MAKNCSICGKPINDKFTCCLDCYKARNRSYFEIIRDDWRLEAKEEDLKYFYYSDEANDILTGKKNIVIGRKGEGKTAIAQYIYQIKNYDIFTEKLTFKDFPFNILYKLCNDQYTRPNQYISIWKYLIYVTICKKMITNEAIDSEVVNKLKKVFPPEDSSLQLNRLIEKYTLNNVGAQILGFGLNFGGEKRKKEPDWIETIELLESIIENYLDQSSYYIIFDELDEDYKNFDSEAEKNDYFDLITGLFKAVQDVKTFFAEKGKKVLPIIFLRTDIYNLITYSDKNKWSDSIIDLIWTPEKLKKLLAHRLNIVMDTKNLSFEACWNRLFSRKPIEIGSRKRKQINTFNYILRSTQNRPRDFIKYFQECSKQILNEEEKFIVTPAIIRNADNAFSEYMRSEIVDEIYAVLPEYDEIFAILSLIRKQTFNPQEFVSKYDEAVQSGKIPKKDAEQVLRLLFDYSVIGNSPSIKNQSIYKYEKNNARFNFKENIIIHRGLFKALQIF